MVLAQMSCMSSSCNMLRQLTHKTMRKVCMEVFVEADEDWGAR